MGSCFLEANPFSATLMVAMQLLMPGAQWGISPSALFTDNANARSDGNCGREACFAPIHPDPALIIGNGC